LELFLGLNKNIKKTARGIGIQLTPKKKIRNQPQMARKQAGPQKSREWVWNFRLNQSAKISMSI
jgi:hypothetical protein